MNSYANQYKKTQVETASPEKILIMLYDGAIQYVKKAKIAMRQENRQEAHNNIIAAEKIITEFMSTLDMEVGGDMAKNLYALYDYLYNKLVTANMKSDPKCLDEVLSHLQSLRDTWAQAIILANREKARTDSQVEVDSEEEGEDEEEIDEDESEQEHSYSA